MQKIPILFQYKDKTYNASFSLVAGSGSNTTYHLMDDRNFYLGRLRQANKQWVFDTTPKTEGFKDMAKDFGDYVANYSQ